MYEGTRQFPHSTFGSDGRSGFGRRRMNSGPKDYCTEPLDEAEHKEEQCMRLRDCAKNFNLYDLFVYYYTDDIDLQQGKLKSESDRVFGEIDVKDRYNRIKSLTQALDPWNDSFARPGKECDDGGGGGENVLVLNTNIVKKKKGMFGYVTQGIINVSNTSQISHTRSCYLISAIQFS